MILFITVNRCKATGSMCEGAGRVGHSASSLPAGSAGRPDCDRPYERHKNCHVSRWVGHDIKIARIGLRLLTMRGSLTSARKAASEDMTPAAPAM